jgi:hypothetical protein
MPVYHIPEPRDSDPDAPRHEARWARLRVLLKPCVEAIVTEALRRLEEGTNAPTHPLRQLLNDLVDCPLEDAFDLQGWIRYLPSRTKIELANGLLACLGEAQIAVANGLDDATF